MSTWTEQTLFEVEPVPVAVSPSPDARRTARNRALLAAGIHPATHAPLRPEGGTCGSCVHHHAERHGGGTRVWHKCDVHRLGRSFSAASDIRISWSACIHFERATT